MRKAILLLLSIVLAVLVIPGVFAEQNSVSGIGGEGDPNMTVQSTTQVTTNPEIGANITYRTEINVTGELHMNITDLIFNLPNNSSTSVITDFQLEFGSDYKNATSFSVGDYNYVTFSNLAELASFNDTLNSSTFNVTWKLDGAIGSTKMNSSQTGRVWAEVWNITSSATNLTIENASLIMYPEYWHTRIGNPTSVLFNYTSKGYTANYSAIEVWVNMSLDLDMQKNGSGWTLLEILYNGPTVSKSAGKSATKPISITPAEVLALINPAVVLTVVLGLIIAGIVTVTIVYFRKK